MIVLYDQNGNYVMHTHWPSINALENFRIIALKKNVIKDDVDDRILLVPAKFADGKNFRDRIFALKSVINSMD